MLTAWTHDFAEAIDGDIPDPDKDHSDDAKGKEKRSFLTVMGSVFNYPEEVGYEVFPVMYGKGELARHFRAIEIIGYTETAKRAASVNGEAYQKLYKDVYPNAIEQLREFSNLPVVAEYLKPKTLPLVRKIMQSIVAENPYSPDMEWTLWHRVNELEETNGLPHGVDAHSIYQEYLRVFDGE
jgi:hypothetical protein